MDDYEITTERTGSWLGKRRRTFVAKEVVLAAGTLGTQKLLHSMRDRGALPGCRNGSASSPDPTPRRFSGRAVSGATSTSPGEWRSPPRSTPTPRPTSSRCATAGEAMPWGYWRTALADGGGRSRLVAWAREVAHHPLMMLRNLSMHRWSEQTIAALVMQPRDNSMTCYTQAGLFGRRLTSTQGHGEPNPTWIPVGHEVVRRLAKQIGGFAAGGWNDVFNVPMTAHLLGGAVIGDSPETGVIDPYHRLYGHAGLHVVDGSAVSANLGVNPSLTITAQAERAMAMWPNKGEDDPRPALGEPYRRIDPIAPDKPAVPDRRPGRLTPEVCAPAALSRRASRAGLEDWNRRVRQAAPRRMNRGPATGLSLSLAPAAGVRLLGLSGVDYQDGAGRLVGDGVRHAAEHPAGASHPLVADDDEVGTDPRRHSAYGLGRLPGGGMDLDGNTRLFGHCLQFVQ